VTGAPVEVPAIYIKVVCDVTRAPVEVPVLYKSSVTVRCDRRTGRGTCLI
jgi:hypothetical protein